MYRVLFFITLSLIGVAACTSENSSTDIEEIKSIMDNQVSCWNQGNLDCFMEGYLQSDSLMFIGKGGIVYGYQNTLDRYHKTYPDQEAMGTLNFNIIHLDQLSPEYYSMVGQWMLDRKEDDLQGHFTLLFKKINGQWFIIKDHSS